MSIPLHLRITALCAAPLAVLSTPVTAQVTAEEIDGPATFDETDGAWTPLEFGLSETSDPWVPVPNGSSGAPRQGWLGAPDGFFTREYHLAYSYTDADAVDVHEGLARFHLPLSRRLWVGAELPFYRNIDGIDDVGDAVVTTQYMLAERRNLSLNAGVGWRVPVGDERIGGGVFSATPQLNLWTDLGAGFSGRGRVSYTFADADGVDSFNMSAAIGQTVTEHDRAPLGDFTWYVSGNWSEPQDGPTFLSVTPGVRSHVGNDLFLLLGVEVPVTNTDNYFDQRVIAQLVKGF